MMSLSRSTHHPPPDLRFPRQPEPPQLRQYLCRLRLYYALFLQLFNIRRILREHHSGNRPAGPGAPGSQLAAGLDHAGREMLKMPSRIPDELLLRPLLHDPAHRPIGQRPFAEDRLIAGKIGGKGAVQEQDGLGGQAPKPDRLSTCQGEIIKISPALTPGCPHRYGGERQISKGKKWARREICFATRRHFSRGKEISRTKTAHESRASSPADRSN